jgi:hypothetical protein
VPLPPFALASERSECRWPAPPGTAAHSGTVSGMSDDATPGKKPPARSVTTRPGTLILRKTKAQAVTLGWNPHS